MATKLPCTVLDSILVIKMDESSAGFDGDGFVELDPSLAGTSVAASDRSSSAVTMNVTAGSDDDGLLLWWPNGARDGQDITLSSQYNSTASQ